MVGAATTTKDVQGRQPPLQFAIPHREVRGIAVIKLLGGIKLGMAHG